MPIPLLFQKKNKINIEWDFFNNNGKNSSFLKTLNSLVVEYTLLRRVKHKMNLCLRNNNKFSLQFY